MQIIQVLHGLHLNDSFDTANRSLPEKGQEVQLKRSLLHWYQLGYQLVLRAVHPDKHPSAPSPVLACVTVDNFSFAAADGCPDPSMVHPQSFILNQSQQQVRDGAAFFLRVLSASPSPHQTVVGKNGWISSVRARNFSVRPCKHWVTQLNNSAFCAVVRSTWRRDASARRSVPRRSRVGRP